MDDTEMKHCKHDVNILQYSLLLMNQSHDLLVTILTYTLSIFHDLFQEWCKTEN